MILQTLLSSSSMIHVLHQCPFSGLFCGKLWFFPLSLSPNIHRFWSQLLFFSTPFSLQLMAHFEKFSFIVFFQKFHENCPKFWYFSPLFLKNVFFFFCFSGSRCHDKFCWNCQKTGTNIRIVHSWGQWNRSLRRSIHITDRSRKFHLQ